MRLGFGGGCIVSDILEKNVSTNLDNIKGNKPQEV